MMEGWRRKKVAGVFTLLGILLIFSVVFLMSGNCAGIILHNGSGQPTDKPADGVIGRWDGSASCVAIGRQYIVTTKHQSGSTSTPVIIEGRTYSISQLWNHPTEDIRLAKLRHTNLSDYVELNSSLSEQNQDIVIGGYGDGWDYELTTGGQVYGYHWDDSSNVTLRWCTNKVEIWSDSQYPNLIKGDFDGLGEGGATTYEGMFADHDSGGGWFIKSGGDWFLAGLNYGTEHAEESWFRNDTNPGQLDPDEFYAVKVRNFVTWINGNIATQPDCAYIASDLNDDCQVNLQDFAEFSKWWLHCDCSLSNNFCEGADFEPTNGCVDLEDLAAFLSQWLAY